MGKKVILVNPSMEELYENAYVKDSVPSYPPLNLLTIAGGIIDNGHECRIIDLNIMPQTQMYEELEKVLKEFKPEVAGITFTSALYSQCMQTISLIKKIVPNAMIIAGGAHASSDAESTLRNTQIDIAVMGEGDFTIQEILSAKSLRERFGIAYKENDKVIINPPKAFIRDLNTLPYPAYRLIDVTKYSAPYTYCRENPVASIETSRGCAWGCVYCNKSVFGRNFRVKSAERTVEEIKRLIDCGFKEFHINDDMFTTQIDRAKKICRMMIEQGLKIHWNCSNGIRVDRVDDELFPLMKRAGCYREIGRAHV